MPNTHSDLIGETTDLVEILQAQGLYTEEVGPASDGGTIINVLREGKYLYTITITRTPGH